MERLPVFVLFYAPHLKGRYGIRDLGDSPIGIRGTKRIRNENPVFLSRLRRVFGNLEHFVSGETRLPLHLSVEQFG